MSSRCVFMYTHARLCACFVQPPQSWPSIWPWVSLKLKTQTFFAHLCLCKNVFSYAKKHFIQTTTVKRYILSIFNLIWIITIFLLPFSISLFWCPTTFINRWCRIMTPDGSGHFNPDVLTVRLTLRLLLCSRFKHVSRESHKLKVNVNPVRVLITCDQCWCLTAEQWT